MPAMPGRRAANTERSDAAPVRPREMKTLLFCLPRACAVLLAALAIGSCTGLAFGDPGGFGYHPGQPAYGFSGGSPYAPGMASPPWPYAYGGPPPGGPPWVLSPWGRPQAQPYAPWSNAYSNDPWDRGRAVTHPEDGVKCDARRQTCYTWSSKRDRWRQDYHETETYFGRKAARRVTDGKPERRH